HRQIWMNPDTSITSSSRDAYDRSIQETSRDPRARTTDPYPLQRSAVALYDVIREDNQWWRDAGNWSKATGAPVSSYEQDHPQPLDRMNGLFRSSGLDLQV